MEHPVLLFDGVCNLCNRFVVCILSHEKGKEIRFAPIQSETGIKLMKQHGVKFRKKEFDTIVFLLDGKVYVRSEAAFKIAGFMKKPYSYVAILKLLPVSLMNFLYDVISKYRYLVFGKQKQCMIPDKQWNDRFLN